MEVTLSDKEVKFLLDALKCAEYYYVRAGSRDFHWEEQHESMVKKLKGE